MLALFQPGFSTTICSSSLQHHYSTIFRLVMVPRHRCHTSYHLWPSKLESPHWRLLWSWSGFVGNGKDLQIHHLDKSILFSASKSFFFNSVLHVPHIKKNFLSIYQFIKDNNLYFEFHLPPLLFVSRIDSHRLSFSKAIVIMDSTPFNICISLLHNQLPFSLLAQILTNGTPALITLPSTKFVKLCLAISCCGLLSLSTQQEPSPAISSIYFYFFNISTFVVHGCMGSSPLILNKGNLYYLSIIDNFSKYIWFFPMPTKFAVNQIFLSFKTYVEQFF